MRNFLTVEDFNAAEIAVFPLGGGKDKTPVGWNRAEWFDNPTQLPEAYGIRIPEGYLIVDVDLYKDGAQESFAKLLELGLNTETFVCRTGRGGYHYWFNVPKGARLSKNPKDSFGKEIFPGVDFLSHGMYIVGPGSEIDGKFYKVERGNLNEIPFVSDELLERLTISDQAIQNMSGASTGEGLADAARYRIYLTHSDPAVQGQHGDEQTYKLVAVGRDFGLSKEEILDCLQEWNQRCQPPWSREELEQKVDRVFKYAKNDFGARTISSDDFQNMEMDENGQPKYLLRWDLDAKGCPKATFNNLQHFLEVSQDEAQTYYLFRDLFKYNVRSENIELTRLPFWRNALHREPLILNDFDLIEIRAYFAKIKRCEFNEEIVYKAVLQVAGRAKYNPLTDWLSGLEWDGVSRLEQLFLEYCNTEEWNEELLIYRKTLGKAFLLAAVWRAFEPGCKWDYTYVFMGGQGIGKSLLVSTLGGQYSSVLLNLKADVETMKCLRNGWFVELPELSAVRKTDINAVKGFTTATYDRYRASYGKLARDYPRECIFIWTINPIEGEGFLVDETGNRRFILVEMLHNVNIEDVARDRDQLFAEAMVLFRQGKRPYEFIKEIEATATKIQKEYGEVDNYDSWMDYFRILTGDKYSYTQLFECLGIHRAEHHSQRFKRRIARCMQKLGWIRSRSGQERCFIRRIDELDI